MITRNPAGALVHYEALAARGSLPIAARGPAWRLFMRVVPPDDPEAMEVAVEGGPKVGGARHLRDTSETLRDNSETPPRQLRDTSETPRRPAPPRARPAPAPRPQLLERGDTGGGVPILAAVGPLQLEVVSSRLSSEYSVEVQYEMMPQTQARWAMAGWEEVDAVLSERKLLNVKTLEDVYGRPVLLFTSGWTLDNAVAEVGERLQLRPYALAPDVQERRRKK